MLHVIVSDINKILWQHVLFTWELNDLPVFLERLDIVLIGSYCHCMPVLIFSASSWQFCCMKFTVYLSGTIDTKIYIYLFCSTLNLGFLLFLFWVMFTELGTLRNFSLQYLTELLSVIALYSFINWRWESIYTSSLKQGRNNSGDWISLAQSRRDSIYSYFFSRFFP